MLLVVSTSQVPAIIWQNIGKLFRQEAAAVVGTGVSFEVSKPNSAKFPWTSPEKIC